MTQSAFSLAVPPSPNAVPVLRPYQVEALAAIRAYAGTGGRRALVALPTGCGKTILFTEVVASMRGSRRALILAHREELLDQAASAVRRAHPELAVGVEQADRAAPDRCDVVVASIPTLVAGGGKRLARLPRREVGVVVVDEAHHTTARTYVQVLAHFGLSPDPAAFDGADWDALDKREKKAGLRTAFERFEVDRSGPFLLGVTATPNRADGAGMEFLFDEIVYSRTIREMIEDGWLAPPLGYRVASGANLDGVSVRGGDFAEGALADAIDTGPRNAVAVRAYQDYAAGRQCLAFTATVEHAQHLASAFSLAGVRAEYVSGMTRSEDRHRVIADYRAGRVQVVCNCAVLTEGFDAPETGCILMARPTKSATLYTQMLGRGSRLAPGKNNFVVIDLVDAYAKAGVANLNVLFGLPPRFDLGGEDAVETLGRFEDLADEQQVGFDQLSEATDWETARRIAQEVDPLQAAAMDPWVANAATMAWVKSPWGYGLSLPDYSLGVVVDQLGHATLRQKYRGDWPRTIGRFGTPAGAVTAAEDYVRTNEPGALVLTSRDAKWQKDVPSEKQLAFAAKLKITVPPNATKGRVSALINAALAKKNGGQWKGG